MSRFRSWSIRAWRSRTRCCCSPTSARTSARTIESGERDESLFDGLRRRRLGIARQPAAGCVPAGATLGGRRQGRRRPPDDLAFDADASQRPLRARARARPRSRRRAGRRPRRRRRLRCQGPRGGGRAGRLARAPDGTARRAGRRRAARAWWRCGRAAGRFSNSRSAAARDGTVQAYRLDVVQDCGRVPVPRRVPPRARRS